MEFVPAKRRRARRPRRREAYDRSECRQVTEEMNLRISSSSMRCNDLTAFTLVLVIPSEREEGLGSEQLVSARAIYKLAALWSAKVLAQQHESSQSCWTEDRATPLAHLLAVANLL